MTSNLIELGSAALKEEDFSGLLSVNPSGTRLYHHYSLQGWYCRARLLSLYEKGMSPYLYEVVKKTHSAFHHYFEAINTDRETASVKTQKKILEWNRVVVPFLKLLHEDQNIRLCQFLKEALPDTESPFLSDNITTVAFLPVTASRL